jgi:hypothetical protein
MTKSIISKIVLALLSYPASMLLALASWRVAAGFSVDTPGNWLSRYNSRYIGFGGDPWDIGIPLRFALTVDTLIWVALLWSTYFLIYKLRRKAGGSQ